MNNELTLVFIDIDGCLVQSFDGKGLNPAAYAEKCKQQPLNDHIVNYLIDSRLSHQYWYGATGRKASVYQAHTEKQFGDKLLCNFERIIYYPEDYGYDPIQQYVKWKAQQLLQLIHEYLPSQIIVLEDDLDVVREIIRNPLIHIPIEFWIVHKNDLLLKCNTREQMEFWL